MKICIPTYGTSGLKDSIYNHFGSSKYFTIYDSETKEINVIENTNSHHQHGQCQPLKAIEGCNVDAVLTSGMGKKAVLSLNGGGVKVFLCEENTVEEAINKFLDGFYMELTVDGACGGHGHHTDHLHNHTH